MTTETIQLIGVGRARAVPLSDVQPGDYLMWNYGETYEVVRNVQVSPQTWELTERGQDGREWTRRKRGSKLVARVPSPTVLRARRYAAKFRADTMCQEPPMLLEPTDENLASILNRCVRPARPDEYPAIRAELAGQF